MAMEQETAERLVKEAIEVLRANDRGGWTIPAGHIYPHQWLWDSCFIAIGLRHVDIERAKLEIRSLLRGQWDNGMVPHIVFNNEPGYGRDRVSERGDLNPFAPSDVSTSGITQPPLIAEAVFMIGQKLKLPERRSWYKEVAGPLTRYHEWLYADRDPHKEGLALLLHPYESGLDNSPPWISELRKHSMPVWVSAVEKLRLDGFINLFRRDVKRKKLPPGQRITNTEALAFWSVMRRMQRKAYNTEAILSRSVFAVEDLAFNCIFIRGNECLRQIARTAGYELPKPLIENMERSKTAIEELFDEDRGLYYSRSFVTHKLIEEPTVASLLPLYSGAISKNHAAQLVSKLKDPDEFGLKWPVPSVPKTSGYFDPFKYWQGPTWVNTNWMIIDGLTKYGFGLEAKELEHETLRMVAKGGMYEYFSPLNAKPAGAADFSWTAALTIDLLKR